MFNLYTKSKLYITTTSLLKQPSQLRSIISRTFVVSALSIGLLGCGADTPTRDDLAAMYPDVLSDSTVAENPKILCPFLRMLNRAGLVDSESTTGKQYVSTTELVSASTKFGCSVRFCGGLAQGTAVAQPGLNGIDIEALHTARAVAHECGLNFAYQGTEVDDTVRQTTLDALQELADDQGRLSYSDLLAVKRGICEQQDVNMTLIGQSEVKLIYAYLGGLDRGYIDFDDVERFFHAELPETLTSKRITEQVLLQVRE